MQNWPADFDISGVYTPPGTETAATTTTSAKAKNKPPHAWASELIASSGSTEFQLPLTHALNKREGQGERRSHKDDLLREQWATAVAAIRTWRWLCGSCVEVLGAQLVGADVLVWWHDDKQAYPGTIDAFDEVSLCHRVLYQDGDWEFVNLTVEPACFGSLLDVCIDLSWYG